MAANVPALDHLSGSWIVVDSEGNAIGEFYSRRNVERLLNARPELTAKTALDYLSGLNEIKSADNA